MMDVLLRQKDIPPESIGILLAESLSLGVSLKQLIVFKLTGIEPPSMVCPQCGKRAYLKSPTKTKRGFCSENCRLNSFRARKAKAMEMIYLGMSANDIAESLDFPVDTILRWVDEPKQIKRPPGRPKKVSVE